MKTNKEMYNEYKKAMYFVERYRYWDYIDNYKDMKREEALFDKYEKEMLAILEEILKLKRHAKLDVYKEIPVLDINTGEEVETILETISLEVIGKQAKDDMVLFVIGEHIYSGEEVKALGWEAERRNGKVIFSERY